MPSRQPLREGTVLFGTSIVMGGSVAGLLAARVLADHAGTVIIVERDDPGTSSEPRTAGRGAAGQPDPRAAARRTPAAGTVVSRFIGTGAGRQRAPGAPMRTVCARSTARRR